jgi:hypothetical protein
MKNVDKKILSEELKRICEIMGIPNKFLLTEIVTPRPVKETISDLLGYFRDLNSGKKSLRGFPNKRTINLPNTNQIEVVDSTLTSLINWLERIDTNPSLWDDFLDPSNREAQELLRDAINGNESLSKDIYNRSIKSYIDEYNQNPINEIIPDEKDFIERAGQYMINNNLSAENMFKGYGFDDIMSSVLAKQIKPKIDAIGNENKLNQLTKNFLTDYEITEKGTEFNPLLWDIDFKRKLTDDEVLELKNIVDKKTLEELTGITEKLSKQAESMRLLFQKMNTDYSRMNDAERKLQDQILEAFDERMREFYESEKQLYNNVDSFLQRNKEKVVPESPLFKLIEKIQEHKTGSGKMWELSLVDNKLRSRVQSIKDGLKNIDWSQILKTPARTILTPLKFLDLFFKNKNPIQSLISKIPPEFKLDSDEFKNILISGGKYGGKPFGFMGFKPDMNRTSKYFGPKYWNMNAKTMAKYEFWTESLARSVKLKVQWAVLNSLFSALSYVFQSEDAEECLKQVEPYLKEGQNAYDAIWNNELGADVMSALTECQNLSFVELSALRFVSKQTGDKKNYIGIIDVFWGTITNELSKENIWTFVYPGLIDDIAKKVFDILDTATTPGVITNIFKSAKEEIVRTQNEIIDVERRGEQWVRDNVSNPDSLSIVPDSSSTVNNTDTTIDGSDSGFKNYLSKLNPPKTFKKWEAADPDYPNSGLPAYGEATDSTGKVSKYQFEDGKWVQFQ